MERPLVFNAISLFMGSLAALIFFSSITAGAALAALFLGLLYFTRNKKDFLLVMLFFILGLISFSLYFSVNMGDRAVIRITEKKYYYYLGDFQGRKIIMQGNIKGIKEGQKISAAGSFKRESDYKRGIAGIYTIKSYTVEKGGLISVFYSMKNNMYMNFKAILGDKNSALLMALCFGDTSWLTNTQMNEFNRLGVIHAISVSGFHMAVVYGVMEKVMGLRAALPAALLYSIFTGMQAATMRAFIMIFVLKLSRLVWKNYDSISSLALAAMLLLVIKPWYILDIGFMLSFLSTLGIILFYKKLNRFFYLLPEKLNETLSISLSAQLFSLPFTAFTLQQFSAGFLLGNLVLLPFYSILVLLGNAALLISFSTFLFGSLCGYISIILKSMEGAAYLLLKLSPEVQYFSWLYGAALLLIYLSFIFYKKGYKYTLYYPIFVILFLCINSFAFFPQVIYQRLQGGSSILVNYKAQRVLICSYDCTKVRDIYKLKEEYGVTKVVANASGIINVGDMKIRIDTAEGCYFSNIDINVGGSIYSIKNKYLEESPDLYVIILNRLFHFS